MTRFLKALKNYTNSNVKL